MKFKTEDGTIIDDALIEEMAEAWDHSEVPGTGSEVRRGRPCLANEEVGIRLSVTHQPNQPSDADQIADRAKRRKETFARIDEDPLHADGRLPDSVAVIREMRDERDAASFTPPMAAKT